MAGTTYFYKVRCQYYTADNPRNESGEDEVHFTAYLNTDLEYGRDYIPWLSYTGGKADQTYGGFGETVPVSELTPERFEELYEEALDALSNT